MSPIIITVPPIPQGTKDPTNTMGKTILPVTEVGLYLWKREYAKAQGCKDKYDENMAKAYIIVYHQCLPTLKNDLKDSDKFATIRQNQDVIALLKLVQSLCCSYNAETQGVMATVASHKCLFTHYQKNGVDNHTYHHELLAHVETIKTYSGVGAVGVVPTFLANKIKELANFGTILDAKNPTDAERAHAVSTVPHDQWCLLRMLW
jgi:hypothetical protein